MGVAENQIGCGHRNFRPTLNEILCTVYILKKIHFRCIKSKLHTRKLINFACLGESKKGVWPGGGVKWTSLILKYFVGAIEPMDQLLNTVGLNFEKKEVEAPLL